ncbi:hypothetical protein KCP74_19005 [Salmonella enterica subsp. enterica]|nr:hypothetical protein KCP74_19005 [Salmonella enterica subsp. enterica]
MAEYYRQRASAGLIISEAAQISAQAKAMPAHRDYTAMSRSPHGKKSLREFMLQGGHMAVQLWHTGRISRQPATRADKRPSRHPLSMREPTLCVTKTAGPSA